MSMNVGWGVVPPRNQTRRVYRFMKKTIKKLTAVGLTLTSVMGLVACGSANDSYDSMKNIPVPGVELFQSLLIMGILIRGEWSNYQLIFG